MPDIDNGQAITFVETQLRTSADKFCQAYYRLRTCLDVYNAGNLGTLFPLTSDLVLDQNQFAHPLTSNDVRVLISVLDGIASGLEANGNANLNAALTAAVNPTQG